MSYVVDSWEDYKEENRLLTNSARRIEFVTTTTGLDEVIGIKGKNIRLCSRNRNLCFLACR